MSCGCCQGRTHSTYSQAQQHSYNQPQYQQLIPRQDRPQEGDSNLTRVQYISHPAYDQHYQNPPAAWTDTQSHWSSTAHTYNNVPAIYPAYGPCIYPAARPNYITHTNYYRQPGPNRPFVPSESCQPYATYSGRYNTTTNPGGVHDQTMPYLYSPVTHSNLYPFPIDTQFGSRMVPSLNHTDPVEQGYRSIPGSVNPMSASFHSSLNPRVSMTDAPTGVVSVATPVETSFSSSLSYSQRADFHSVFPTDSSAVGTSFAHSALFPNTTFHGNISHFLAPSSPFSIPSCSASEQSFSAVTSIGNAPMCSDEIPFNAGRSELSPAESSIPSPMLPSATQSNGIATAAVVATTTATPNAPPPAAEEGKLPIARVQRRLKRPVQKLLSCKVCLEKKGQSTTFKGQAELRRHQKCHVGDWWICHDIKEAYRENAPCATCADGKLYARADNAIGHMRRKHFNRIGDDSTQKSRGGSGGGDYPSVQYLLQEGYIERYTPSTAQRERRYTDPVAKTKRAKRAQQKQALAARNSARSKQTHNVQPPQAANSPVSSNENVEDFITSPMAETHISTATSPSPVMTTAPTVQLEASTEPGQPMYEDIDVGALAPLSSGSFYLKDPYEDLNFDSATLPQLPHGLFMELGYETESRSIPTLEAPAMQQSNSSSYYEYRFGTGEEYIPRSEYTHELSFYDADQHRYLLEQYNIGNSPSQYLAYGSSSPSGDNEQALRYEGLDQSQMM